MNGQSNLSRPVGSARGLESLLRAAQAQIERVLPKHLTPDRLIQIASVAVTRVPALARCTELSLLTAVMRAGELGLDCSGALGSAYLVPFGTECQLIIGYRGLIDLARRSGQIVSIEARVVYQNDEFDLRYGTDATLTHRPALDQEPGAFRLVYAVAHLKGGGVQTEVMTKAAVDAIRSRSKTGSTGPWKTDYDEMARKTVVKRLCKYLPLSVDVQQTIADDERREYVDGAIVAAKSRDLNAPLDAVESDAHELPPDDGFTQLPPDEVAQRVLAGPTADADGVEIDPGDIDPLAAEDGAVTAADLADWPAAEKLLWDKAKDMRITKPGFGTAVTAALGLVPAKSTPDKRLAFMRDITAGAFAPNGSRLAAAPA